MAGWALTGGPCAAAVELARSSRRTRMATAAVTAAANAIPEATRNPRAMPVARASW
jgi:hypothetical protein